MKERMRNIVVATDNDHDYGAFFMKLVIDEERVEPYLQLRLLPETLAILDL